MKMRRVHAQAFLALVLSIGLLGLSAARDPAHVSAGQQDQPSASSEQDALVFTDPTNLRVFTLSPSILRFQWDPGSDNFWFCVDTAFSAVELFTMTGSWANWGCGTTAPAIEARGIRCGTLHYARVYAAGPGVGGYTAPVSFYSGECGFGVPSNLQTTPLAPNAMRFSWSRGGDNQWFCIDTAFTSEDLVGFRGSFANWGCGTTATVLDIVGLQCGTLHYWRVYARGTVSDGHSATSTFTMPACAAATFTPPSNLQAIPLANTAMRFSWTAGSDNLWFCIDTALSSQDLNTFSGSWKNYSCGMTTTTIDISGLTCNTNYFWRVYARGTTVAGYSSEAQARTTAC